MKILNYLPPKQRRLGVLIVFVIILSGWVIILPPTDQLETIELISQNKDTPKQTQQKWYSLEISEPDLQAWNLSLIRPVIEKTVVTEKKVIKPKFMPKTSVILPVPQPPIIMNIEQPEPMSNLPQIKYLGQVVDSTGLQVFLIIDDSSVVMRPKRIYEQTWQIVSVDDNEVRLMHLPTQQIMHVSKS